MPARPKTVERITPEEGVFTCPIVIDTREQTPYAFQAIPCDVQDGGGELLVPTVRDTLESGDYSLQGYEKRISIERKSLQDLYGTIGQNRERFERELERLASYEFAAVVIEAHWWQICSPGKLTPDVQCVADMRTEWFKTKEQSGESVPVTLASTLDQLLVAIDEMVKAQAGSRVHSELPPKTVVRSIFAWQQRYGVHFFPAGPRRLAELTTFRLLERFLKDQLSSTQTGSSK